MEYEKEDVNLDLDPAHDLDNDSSVIEAETEVVETDVEEGQENVEEDSQEDSENVEEVDEQQKRQSKAVPYERFAEVNEKAKERDLIARENELLRQQLEFQKNSSNPQQQYIQPTPQEDPQITQAKEVLKNQFGLVDRTDIETMLQEREADSRAISSVLQQESALKQKFAGRNVPQPDAKELVTWFEAQGFSVNKHNIPANFLETAYKLKYGDKLEQSYAASKPRPAPMAKTSAPGIGKGISEDDFFNAPADKTDEYWSALNRTVK
jgi:hypothetical protein